MAITLVQLKASLAVERTGTFKAAAADLVVTQLSISGAISARSNKRSGLSWSNVRGVA